MAMEVKLLQPVKVVCTDDLGETLVDIMQTALCETVESGVEAFEAHKADSIIAIGGGSSMDVARGINIVSVNGGSIIEYTDPAKPIAPCNGMIAVPTTAGTGSEMSNALVVTEGSTGRKLSVLADPAVSEYAVPFAKKRCSCCTTICRVLWQTVRIVKPGNV